MLTYTANRNGQDMKDIAELEKLLKDLGNVKYITQDANEIPSPCAVEMSYEGGQWIVWLTDCAGSARTAEAFRYVDGEVIEGALNVGMGFDVIAGDCEKNVFGDCGATLEEAVNKLAAKVALLRQHPEYCLVFVCDD